MAEAKDPRNNSKKANTANKFGSKKDNASKRHDPDFKEEGGKGPTY